ncbi:MAG: glycosyltransferase family 2 protein [Candidatus Shapirobacteria bacterium]|nr:glycosyltransferase family 2 protein [Candidatus Shapirobacteria bacterium]
MDHIAIVVLNWNQPKLTKKTIDSLQKITHPQFNYHFYLLDNGSSDNSYSQFEKLYLNNKQFTLLKTNDNLGFVGGNNYVLKIAKKNKYDYYLLINNDVIVKPDFLTVLHSYLKKNKTVSLVGPKIYFAPGFEYKKNLYSPANLGKVIWFAGGLIDWQNIYCSHRGIDEIDVGQYDIPLRNPDYLTGCCLLFSHQLLTKLTGFDNRYYLYLEDADFCVRARHLGFNTAFVPESVIWHLNSGSSSAGGSLHDYFITRNRLLFGFHYASFRTKIALFRNSFHLLSSSPSKWQKRGVVDYYLNRFGKGSWQ